MIKESIFYLATKKLSIKNLFLSSSNLNKCKLLITIGSFKTNNKIVLYEYYMKKYDIFVETQNLNPHVHVHVSYFSIRTWNPESLLFGLYYFCTILQFRKIYIYFL